VPSSFENLTASLRSSYEIEKEIGQGGMATVYRARDLRHQRTVAVKVLLPELAATLGTQRFLQEIRIAANLTHPHILPVHESGEAGGFLYYVMPYIEGESLRARLDHEHELPIGDVVRILREVADALSYAHAHGVVHRDVKPANILLSGRHALVTDFGVAKAVSEATGRQRITTVGVALGTPTYMAPEQAAADPHLDHRVDIYALGVVGYELLAGRPPFLALQPQALLTAHMTETPAPVRTHRANVPEVLDHLILRCLEKRAADRFQSADEIVDQLEALITPSGGVTPTLMRPVTRTTRRPWRGAALALAPVLALGTWGLWTWLSAGSAQASVGATTRVTFDPALELSPAISPDGRYVAYVAMQPAGQDGTGTGGSSVARILVRQVDGGGRPIPVAGAGAADEHSPRWSPDGSRLLFRQDGRLFEVAALGGTPRPVFASPLPGDALDPAWSPDGKEVAYVSGGWVMAYAVATGEHREITSAPGPHSPAWSPDGRWIAFVSGNANHVRLNTLLGNVAPSAIVVVPATGGAPVTVVPDSHLNVSPAWLPGGRLLFVSNRGGGGTDIYQVSIGSDGGPDGAVHRVTTGLDPHTISVSGDGARLSYVTLLRRQNVQTLALTSQAVSGYDGESVTTGRQVVEGIAISPDGEWLAFDSNLHGNQDVFVRRIASPELVRVTDHPADEFVRGWSPDGRWLTGHGFRSGNRDVYVVGRDGSGYEIVFDGQAHDRYPDWSPDGRALAFQSAGAGGAVLYVSSRSEDGSWSAPDSLTEGNAARWSPDGSRIAYMYRGRSVRVIPSGGGEPRDVVSAMGNGQISWSADGERLVYLDRLADGSAEIRSVRVEGGTPRTLVRFEDRLRSPRDEFALHGDRVYYTFGELEGDVWVVDLVER